MAKGHDCGEGLSVIDEPNIILALYEESELHEYSSDVEIFGEIILLREIINTMHALKLTNGDFLVSHGFQKRDLHNIHS